MTHFPGSKISGLNELRSSQNGNPFDESEFEQVSRNSAQGHGHRQVRPHRSQIVTTGTDLQVPLPNIEPLNINSLIPMMDELKKLASESNELAIDSSIESIKRNPNKTFYFPRRPHPRNL